MNRLFYDCPIEAGYMAVKFGVEFILRNGLRLVLASNLVNSSFMWKVSDVVKGKEYLERSFLIKADSLHIFQPQIGDVMGGEIAGNRRTVNAKNIVTYRKLIAEGKSRIIERGGVVFLAPKVGL